MHAHPCSMQCTRQSRGGARWRSAPRDPLREGRAVIHATSPEKKCNAARRQQHNTRSRTHAMPHPIHAQTTTERKEGIGEGRKEGRKEGRLGRKDCWRRPFRPSSSAAAAAMRTSDWTVTGHKGSTFVYGKLRTVDVGKQTVCRNQVLTLSRLIN